MNLFSVLYFVLELFSLLTLVMGSDNDTSVTEKESKVLDSCMDTCPENWEREGQNCFFWGQETMTWNDAEETCGGYGAHLSSLASLHIYEHITSKIAENTWIGATNKTGNQMWTWTDGSSLPLMGKPDGNGSCAFLTSNGTGSNKEQCEKRMKFVCRAKVCQGQKSIWKRETS